ncbi:Splicing factor 3A subunit 2 [Geranomyces variabilis]|nr:Splicing factor 3A subunit 2 [Geranomyces variabilis]KAJ3162267.1 Splicing factor 3A subunit 2 [Geranomyces variabilis]
MDFQNRAGSKPGSGGVAGGSESNVDRRDRLRKLALETIDLAKDPYFMKNHLGSYECKLCLTLHNNEGSYLAHTQGKKHQTNLARRAARDAQDGVPGKDQPLMLNAPPGAIGGAPIVPRKVAVKIGRPGYKVTKIRDPTSRQLGLLFQIQYPEAADGIRPRHRFMSAYEQHREEPNKAFQYLLFAAEPYETIAFKVQSKEIDRAEGRFWTYWDPDARQFHLQFFFKSERLGYAAGAPGVGGPGVGVVNPGRAALMGMVPPPGLANPLNPFGAPPPQQPAFVNH